MSTNDKHQNRLGDLLREGDPAGAGSELSREESADLRRMVLRNVHPIPRTHWFPIAALATAALFAVVLLLPDKTSPPPSVTDTQPGLTENRASEPPRQIRFATENGTQIIWVLNADLDVWNKESS